VIDKVIIVMKRESWEELWVVGKIQGRADTLFVVCVIDTHI